MPRRKPAPKPKRKAARKSAPTQKQRDYAAFTEATNAAAAAALAPLQAQMDAIKGQILTQQSLVLKDIAAAVRAAAEAHTQYALVLPTPTHALIARNAEHAAQAYPDDHTYTPAPYLSQTSLEDEPQNSAEYFSRLTAGVSAPARALLYLVAGRWADATYTPSCELDTDKHGAGCKHEARSVPFTLNALARDLYGSAGGKQAAQVYALLQELESVQITYGKTETDAQSGIEQTAARLYEPLVVAGLKGVGLAGESRKSGNLHRHLILAKGLHNEYRTGSYRRIRRALLTGWTGWQQELALRLYSHIGTYYGARRLLRSADKRSGTISIGRTDKEPMDLGGIAHLLPSYGDDPKALQRKLEEFAQEVNRRSEPTELHFVGIRPIKKGRHTQGWAMAITYPEPPLTAKQRNRLQAAEGKRQLAALIGAPQRAQGAQKVQERAAKPAPDEVLRVEVDSYGNEVVVLAAEKPKPAAAPQDTPPLCSHGVAFTLQPAGVSKRTNKPYKAFWQARHKTDNGEWCKEKQESTA